LKNIIRDLLEKIELKSFKINYFNNLIISPKLLFVYNFLKFSQTKNKLVNHLSMMTFEERNHA